jgi:hypothetical protein
MQTTYSLAVAFLDMYSREMKTYIHIKTYTWMFIDTLYVIVKNKNWKELNPSLIVKRTVALVYHE